MAKLPLLIFLGALLTLGTVSSDDSTEQVGEESSLDPGAFPITIDFHCSRNFGFHIGDEFVSSTIWT